MSIPGKQNINVGLPNEPTGSDSLRAAFIKVENNFSNLFACASPYNTFTAGSGVGVVSNANTGTVTITNAGVTNIIAGTNITIDQSNGNVTISSTGGGSGDGGGTVTSVGLEPISNTRISVVGGPNIVSSGTFLIDLATSGAVSGSYNNPNMTIDSYGRITSIANGNVAGTVTSVGLVTTPGSSGIQISGGPITGAGNITITNTGVLRINPGQGISVSSGNGNVTISTTTTGGTVTSVGITSDQLLVTGSPVVQSGIITVNLPDNTTFAGNVTAGNILSSGAITSNSATAGIGYRIGSGGTETQLTDKSTSVTLNKLTGEITMSGVQLNGDSTVSFTLNNSTIANTDVIILNQVSAANRGEYAFNGSCNTGNAVISVHNMTNTNRSDAIVIRYVVIKAAIS